MTPENQEARYLQCASWVKFPQRTIQEKIKFNNHKNLLKEYKQLEFIEREVGLPFMSTEEYTRLNSLKKQLGK